MRRPDDDGASIVPVEFAAQSAATLRCVQKVEAPCASGIADNQARRLGAARHWRLRWPDTSPRCLHFSRCRRARCWPDVDAATHAVGRSRSARQLLEQIRAGHAVRAARGVRRPPPRPDQGRRARADREGAGRRSAPQFAIHRRRSGCRQLRWRAGVLRSIRSQSRQPSVVRRRSG